MLKILKYKKLQDDGVLNLEEVCNKIKTTKNMELNSNFKKKKINWGKNIY